MLLDILVLGALGYLVYENKDKILEKLKGVQKKQQTKYEFGKFVPNPKQTLMFWVEAKNVPFQAITNIFICNNKTLVGISAVCYIMPNNKHSWKLYADDSYKDVIEQVAKEIYDCYNT